MVDVATISGLALSVTLLRSTAMGARRPSLHGVDTVEKVDLGTDDMVIGQNLVPVSRSCRTVVATKAGDGGILSSLAEMEPTP